MTPFQPLVYSPLDWSLIQWIAFLREDSTAQQIVEKYNSWLPDFSSFATEVFARLYGDPPRLPESEILPECAWAVKLHQQLEDEFVPDFSRLKISTSGDAFLSGVATIAFIDGIFANIPVPKFPMESVKDLRANIQALYDLNQIKDHTEEASLPQSQQDLINGIRIAGKNAIANINNFASGLDEATLRHLIREAAKHANEVILIITDQMNTFGWGLDENGLNPKQLGGSLKDKMRYAEYFKKSEKLQKIAKNAGRLIPRALKKQRGRVKWSAEEIVDIEPGRDIGRLLSSELAKCALPETKPLFYKGYAEGTLSQYRFEGRETEGRGAICICLDSSGSMTGTREVWAKSVCLAIATIAAQQKRHFRIIHFEGSVRQVDDFPAGMVNTQTLLESMDVFFNGDGTNWMSAIDEAIAQIKSGGMQNADVILITDGKCRVAPDWLQEYNKLQNQLGFTCWGVLIGAATDAMAEICHKLIKLPDLNQDTAIDELFDI